MIVGVVRLRTGLDTGSVGTRITLRIETLLRGAFLAAVVFPSRVHPRRRNLTSLERDAGIEPSNIGLEDRGLYQSANPATSDMPPLAQ